MTLGGHNTRKKHCVCIGASRAAPAPVPGTTGTSVTLSLVPRHDVDNSAPLQDDDVLGFAKDIDWCPD